MIAVVALAVCLAGLVATWNIKSPQQQAVEQSPPPPSVLTAPVRSDVLAQQIVARGTAVTESWSVRALGGAAPAIVTAVPQRQGALVGEGDVLIEVSGRPVIAMVGQTPAYRAMTSDTSGKDVVGLQAGLERLGYLRSYEPGQFDWATRSAVADLYRDRGYEAACAGSTPMVCLGEIVFVATLPATVASLEVGIGDDATKVDELMSLNIGQVLIEAVVPSNSETGLAVGLGAVVTDDANRRECVGSVASVESFSAGSVEDDRASGFPVRISTDGCVDVSWLDLNVRVVIDVQATDQPVLIVPTTAIRTGDDGSAFVLVDEGDEDSRRVAVATGLIAGGEVEVVPDAGQSLEVGDLVVLG